MKKILEPYIDIFYIDKNCNCSKPFHPPFFQSMTGLSPPLTLPTPMYKSLKINHCNCSKPFHPPFFQSLTGSTLPTPMHNSPNINHATETDRNTRTSMSPYHITLWPSPNCASSCQPNSFKKQG